MKLYAILNYLRKTLIAYNFSTNFMAFGLLQKYFKIPALENLDFQNSFRNGIRRRLRSFEKI